MNAEDTREQIQNSTHLSTTYLGQRESRMGVEENVGIPDENRLTHVLTIGATGTGKTQSMVHAALQDIEKGRGLCYINPKGDATDQILAKMTDSRLDDVVYINPAETPVTPINPLQPHITDGMSDAALENQKEIIVGDILAMFKRQSKEWGDQWPRILSTLLRAHLDLNIRYDEGNTLADVLRCITDTDRLTELIDRTDDPTLRSHLVDIRDNVSDHALMPLKRRIQDFMGNQVIRRIIDSPESGVDFYEAVTEGKIILVEVQRGEVGRNVSPLVGSLVLTQIWAAVQARIGLPPEERDLFAIYVDEVKHFASESSNFDELLSESREYGASVWAASQYLDQLDAEMQRALVNNCRSKLVFQPEVADDGNRVARMLLGTGEEAIQRLGQYRAFLQLPTDGEAVAFSTFPPYTGERDEDEVARIKREQTIESERSEEASVDDLLNLGPGDNAGKQLHTMLLQKAKAFLEARDEVVRVNLLHQDPGTEQPDGEIVTSAGVSNLEAEASTLSKPGKVLQNAVRALQQGRKVVFVTEEPAAPRLVSILEDPVRDDGEPYTLDGDPVQVADLLDDLEYRVLVHTANGKIRYRGETEEAECPEVEDENDIPGLRSMCLYRSEDGSCELLDQPCVLQEEA